MNDQPKHTPTPWGIGRISETEQGMDRITITRDRGYGEFAVWLDEDEGDGINNARFIVRAVNAHDALVKALSDLLVDYLQEQEDEYSRCKTWLLENCDVFKQAHAALALAEGEPTP